jgi:hypothetical protein
MAYPAIPFRASPTTSTSGRCPRSSSWPGKAFDDKLNYVTGLYYFNEGGYVHDYVPFERSAVRLRCPEQCEQQG